MEPHLATSSLQAAVPEKVKKKKYNKANKKMGHQRDTRTSIFNHSGEKMVVGELIKGGFNCFKLLMNNLIKIM